MAVLLTILAYVGIVVFIVVMLVGVLATLVGLPGTVLILLDALIYSAIHSFAKPPWWMLLILVGVSVVAETSDNILSMAGVKKFGGSGKTSLWALGGGVAGAIIGGSLLAPLLAGLGPLGILLPPIACALVGGYLAAYWYELRQGKSRADARQSGWGALLWRLAGGLTKAVLASVMVALILWSVFGT